MASNQGPHNNWRVVSPPGAVRVDVPRRRARKRRSTAILNELDRGAAVVLFATAPGAVRRCRRFANARGIDVEREFLAFPSASSAAYLVEDSPATARVFVGNVLVTPPRIRFATLVDASLGVIRTFGGWRLIRRLAPGRVVIGTLR